MSRRTSIRRTSCRPPLILTCQMAAAERIANGYEGKHSANEKYLAEAMASSALYAQVLQGQSTLRWKTANPLATIYRLRLGEVGKTRQMRKKTEGMKTWPGAVLIATGAIASTYGGFDEWHQSFVPGRSRTRSSGLAPDTRRIVPDRSPNSKSSALRPS